MILISSNLVIRDMDSVRTERCAIIYNSFDRMVSPHNVLYVSSHWEALSCLSAKTLHYFTPLPPPSLFWFDSLDNTSTLPAISQINATRVSAYCKYIIPWVCERNNV